mgnify:CR=1 FL=1
MTNYLVLKNTYYLLPTTYYLLPASAEGASTLLPLCFEGFYHIEYAEEIEGLFHAFFEKCVELFASAFGLWLLFDGIDEFFRGARAGFIPKSADGAAHGASLFRLCEGGEQDAYSFFARLVFFWKVVRFRHGIKMML